jgi:flagellin
MDAAVMRDPYQGGEFHMRIMNNVGSLNAWRNLTGTDGALSKSLERLSSGFRINRAADDVAGLAISENMRAQIRGFNQAVRNAQDGISLVQTAEGSLNEVHSMLQRMRELAVQAANGTLQPEDRKAIQTELDNLTMETTRISNAAKFNNKDLIDGSLQDGNIGDITLQIGPNGGQTVTFGIGAMDAKTLGISRDVMIGIVDNGTAAGAAGAQNVSVAGLADDTVAQPAIVSTGAGLAAGTYQIEYILGEIQLLDANGDAIGGRVAWAANSEVTIGDVNSAQTLTVRTGGTEPLVTGTDTVRVGSMVGEVVEDSAVAGILADVNGVGTVGYGLASGDYTVRLIKAGADVSVQLFDSLGVTAIGAAVTTDVNGAAIAGGATVELGDAIGGRTVRVTLEALPADATYNASIRINNNGQSAEAAKFDGGAKILDSRAFAGLNVSSQSGASDTLAALDSAIAAVSAQRALLGAIQNRLEHTINNLQVVSENLVASESRIRDVDMALEMTQFTKNQILMQAGTAMLAQANAKNQAVLQLLQ